MQPPALQPTIAWSTPEKSRREGKSILELNSKPIDYTLTEVARTFVLAPASQFLRPFFRFFFFG
jgi:hypothetical protein